MFLLSDMLSNRPMKSIHEIRLENLERLVEKFGTAESLADRSGLSPVYISQIRSGAVDMKTGKRRNLGSAAARKLEIGSGNPTGWMDKDHTASLEGWPLKTITPERWALLSGKQQEAIEEWIDGQITAYTGATTNSKSTTAA